MGLDDYEEPVFLNDFAPTNARLRYVYMHELSLPFKIEVFCYHYGNNLGSLWYAWRIPSDPAKYDPNKTQQKITQIKQNVKLYHSREMRRQFAERFGLVLNAKPSVITELYQFLTGDSSATSISDDVRRKLRFLLDSQDPEVIYDLRDVNPGRPQIYEPFWQECRRYGTVCHFAFAFSVRDLRDQVLGRRPDLEAPSLEWIRAQFWPRNPFRRTAAQYTGRLQIKYMVQSRQLHADHVDGHYAAAIFKYVKQFAIMFRGHVTMAFLDDKHNIKVGEPGFPVAAVDRGKEVLVGLNAKFTVGDHDFTKAKITPSVALICDVPESLGESFYRGRVVATFKDAIFQPSSPYRHAAELKKVLLTAADAVNPILCIYTDGGPDHRKTFLTVQISLISLFRSLDLDMLVAARTAPENSYRNPVERIMSVINLGLQSIGIMRQKMSDENEKLICNGNSMEEVRKAAAKNPGLKGAFADSMQPATCLLTEVTSRLKLKDEPFRVHPPCTEDEIVELWDQIHTVDSSVQKTDSQQAQLKARKELHAFMEHCCVRRRFFFCIKKCGMEGCRFCKPPMLPLDIFQKLKTFPDPIKSPSSDSFRDFADVYGKTTSEKDRPSLLQQKEKPKKPFRMSAETVCDVLVCGDCLKPRCLYAKRKLSRSEHAEVQRCKEEYFYSCGGTIFPETSELAPLCCPELVQGCEECICPHYYSSRLQCTPCCYSCGAFGELRPISSEMKRNFQTVHPVCTDCSACGKSERTRGPRIAGKKRTASESV